MNRNDLVITTTSTISINGGARGGGGGVDVSMGGIPHTRTARKSSSMSPSPSSKKKKSASSLFVGNPGGLSLPKGTPLLEGESVHLALPSFHARLGGNNGVWKCGACQHENQSALSNECSVCGMERSAVEEGTHELVSMGSSEPSDDSFQYDGNQSENSLSLHNSFSAVDPKISEELAPYSFGHSSVPTLAASTSTTSSATARMHNSFSASSTHRRSHNIARGHRNHGRLSRNSRMGQDEGNSSVRSFSDWNGNERIKSWQCQTCTFINENVLHLNCEMCGQARYGASTVPPAAAAASSSSASSNLDDLMGGISAATDDAYLNHLQEEQLRELMGLQEEIMASLESEQKVAAATSQGGKTDAFGTGDLQHEIDHLQSDITRDALGGLGFLVDDSDDEGSEDEEARLQELLAAQTDILKGFQQGRSEPPLSPPRMSKKPMSLSPSPRARAHHPHHDPLFGNGPSNTAPMTNAGISLKESMQAAGGKLRIEDICVPLLWGENISSGKATSGKIQT